MRDGGRDVSGASPYGGAMEFETSTFVFLNRAYPQPLLSEEDRERVQQEHLDYLTRLTEEDRSSSLVRSVSRPTRTSVVCASWRFPTWRHSRL